MIEAEFLKWFSADQFFAELIGTFVVVFGGLSASAFAINKFKNTPFTFGIANSLVIFLAPLAGLLVIMFFNNFQIVTWPFISPVNFISTIIYNFKNENNYDIFKSIPYILIAQVFGMIIGVITYHYFFQKLPNIKSHKDPIDKHEDARNSIFKEVLYIGIFSAFLAFNKIVLFEKNSLGFFVSNLLNTALSLIFLISAYKHGYFTTNLYALIGYNILLRIRNSHNIYSLSHCFSVAVSYVTFSTSWSFAISHAF